MSKKEVVALIEKMPIEEKLKLLSETDKAYICGFIERAVIGYQKQRNNATVSNTKSRKAMDSKNR